MLLKNRSIVPFPAWSKCGRNRVRISRAVTKQGRSRARSSSVNLSSDFVDLNERGSAKFGLPNPGKMWPKYAGVAPHLANRGPNPVEFDRLRPKSFETGRNSVDAKENWPMWVEVAPNSDMSGQASADVERIRPHVGESWVQFWPVLGDVDRSWPEVGSKQRAFQEFEQPSSRSAYWAI